SNAGPGYVLRRLIRRAVRHARTLNLGKEDILKIASIYIDRVYAESYPLLVKNREFILSELQKEIERFEGTLETGMKELRKLLDASAGQKKISGRDAFFLYDTYGFPLELTVELAQEEGFEVDEAGFAEAMEEQKAKAREGQSFAQKSAAGAGLFDGLGEDVTTEFVGYGRLTAESKVVALSTETESVSELTEGQRGILVTTVTPFYATMGGQKGDTGVIRTADGVFEVTEAVKLPGNRVGHMGFVKSGRITQGDTVSLAVDTAERSATCRNHSATHLLQKALQDVLGDHVEQQGSYQDPLRTRFDFSHGQAMTAEELRKVEDEVNEKIAADLEVRTDVMSLEDAKKTGAMALFGEKYGDTVRVVNMGDYSVELCGGTHVARTGQIGSFKILSENGVAAGVRRIEAITGENVRTYYRELEEKLEKAAKTVKTTPAALLERLERMNEELKSLQSENEALKAKAAKDAIGDVTGGAVEIGGVKLLSAAVPGLDMNGLRDLGDQLKAKLGESVVVLFSEADGRVNLVAMTTEGAVKAGAHAGNLIKEVAPLVGGGGGGRPNMAQAGGKNPAGVPEAVAKVAEVLKKQLGV
ncbi:MAG: alanine--tRNA ligase, partial [Lachnospiraceae bacterium]|nr:alanine--tRNA ligase [Lachnospiraceae bacterium]